MRIQWISFLSDNNILARISKCTFEEHGSGFKRWSGGHGVVAPQAADHHVLCLFHSERYAAHIASIGRPAPCVCSDSTRLQSHVRRPAEDTAPGCIWRLQCAAQTWKGDRTLFPAGLQSFLPAVQVHSARKQSLSGSRVVGFLATGPMGPKLSNRYK